MERGVQRHVLGNGNVGHGELLDIIFFVRLLLLYLLLEHNHPRTHIHSMFVSMTLSLIRIRHAQAYTRLRAKKINKNTKKS